MYEKNPHKIDESEDNITTEFVKSLTGVYHYVPEIAVVVLSLFTMAVDDIIALQQEYYVMSRGWCLGGEDKTAASMAVDSLSSWKLLLREAHPMPSVHEHAERTIVVRTKELGRPTQLEFK